MSAYADLLRLLTDPEATGLHNDAADAIAKLEAERDALVSAMSGCVGTLSGPQAGNFIITLEFLDWQRRDDALKILTNAKLLSEATHTPAGN